MLVWLKRKLKKINYYIQRKRFRDEEIENLVIEMVNQHNILLFRVAGNYGPFYASSLAYDCNVKHLIFTIGAIITPEVKKWIYDVPEDIRENSPPVLYDFSSRGPGAMGCQGIDFVAEGAVVADFPQFSSEKLIALSGTSYSTPNAAGAVSCLLSALKYNGIEYSPFSIKFALTKTAFLPENRNKFEFGHGIIQIDSAYDFICNQKINYHNLPRCMPKAGGIFFQTVMEREIHLSTFIDMDTVGSDCASTWTFKLSPGAEKFIELSKIDENKLFKVKINTNNLEEGTLNFAEILVMDPLIGSIFWIPINVVFPLKITETNNWNIQKEITLDHENPHYIIVDPISEDIKKCNIKITAIENSDLNLCIKYIIRGEDYETKETIPFVTKTKIQTHSIDIKNDAIYEFCIYQKIGSMSNTKIKLDFHFESDQNN